MIVVITGEAEANLEQIGDWIAEDNPLRAVTFVQTLRDKCLALAEVPLGFPLEPRYELSGIRRRPFRDYLIFYRVRGDALEILHVLHAAQDYERILFPDK
ncbi:type II toxin-antitoxin system RelE/ParE family toxin [Pleomorphomonas sp. PLEO]|uniref:type II toxin-antitoxin system RelE/ParE family toxin n=1 Tax=Pleomorphomonas sp. PLEO TaxID=3239306 RepID=UPI00351EBF2F